MNINGLIGHKRQIDLLNLMLKKRAIPQTLLFYGIPGIGKSLIANRFLNSLFCKEEPSPCLTCRICSQVIHGSFPDLVQLNPNSRGTIPIGDRNKREEGSVRRLIDLLSKKSVSGKYGVIINGIDRVSREGEIALLKTIEEPQEGACIILIADSKSRILPAIISRCVEIPFSSLKSDDVNEILNRLYVTGESRELAVKCSCGSVSFAIMLSKDGILESFIEICVEISKYIDDRKSLRLDFSKIIKSVNADDMLTVFLNIYRHILVSHIMGTAVEEDFADADIMDIEKLSKIIKIFLALREGLSNNLNIRNSLKGMLYSLDDMAQTGIPELDLSFSY